MLSQHKQLSSLSPSQLLTASELAQQLECLWQQAGQITPEYYFPCSHSLLLQLLTQLDRHRFRKPDWRSVYYKHLSASLRTNCQSIPLYYFRLASVLSSQLSLATLIRLLAQERISGDSSDLEFSVRVLKINYSIGRCDSRQFQKYFDFLEKVSVKLFKFMATLSSPECQEIFSYYLSLSGSKQSRFRKIVTSAFDCFCKYSVANTLPLKWNIFEIMVKITNFYDKAQADQYQNLFGCCLQFINLAASNQVVKYVTLAAGRINAKEQIGIFVGFLEKQIAIQGKRGRHQYSQLLEHLCFKCVLSGSSALYFDLTPIPTHSTALFSQLTLVLCCHNDLKNFTTYLTFDHFSKWLTSLDSCFQNLKSNISEEAYLNLVTAFIIDLNKFINSDVVPLTKRYDMTDILSVPKTDMTLYVAFLPLYRFIAKYAPLNRKPNFTDQLLAVTSHKIFCCLAIICILSDSQTPQKTLVAFIVNEYAKILSQDRQNLCLLRTLVTLNRLAWSRYSKLAYKLILAVTQNVRIEAVLYQPKNYTIFVSLKKRYRKKCELCSVEICKICKESEMFASRIFYEQFRAIIAMATLRDSPSKGELALFEEMIQILNENYHVLQDDSCDEVIQLLTEYASKHQKSDFLFSRCKKLIFETLSQDFLQTASKYQQLSNALDLYRHLLSKKGQLSQLQKLQLIDCMAHLKRLLSGQLARRAANENKSAQMLQNLIDRSQEMESQYLDGPPREHIEALTKIIADRSLAFEIFVSVCLKSIYFLIIPKNDPKSDFFSPEQPPISVEQSKPKNQYQFLSSELEQMSCKLKNIKAKLKIWSPIWDSYGRLQNSAKIANTFSLYTLDFDNENYVQIVLWQLHDLIYLAFLSDLHSLKTTLIGFRLSLMQKYGGREAVMLELAKLTLYELIGHQEQNSLKSVLAQQLETAAEGQNMHYAALLKLITNGEATSLPQSPSRILKIIHLLKQPPIVYFGSFKTIISYLFAYTNSEGQNQSQIQSVGTLLNHSAILYKDHEFNFNLQIEGLLNGWSCLQLLSLFSRKILAQSLELNQLSKTKTIDRFTAHFLIRSGNLGSLDLLFTVLYKKGKQIDWLKAADSLRNVVAGQISANEYKKIDRILCDKRKSLSFGISFEKMAGVIDCAFRDCGRIGVVLSQIFMMIVKEMLKVDQWIFWRCRAKMQLHLPQLRPSFVKQIAAIEAVNQTNARNLGQELQLDWQLAGGMSRILFQSYREATALKDYIAQFINLAIEQPQSSSHNAEIDRLIGFIALCFEEFNYHVKELWLMEAEDLVLSDSIEALGGREEAILGAYNSLKSQYQQKIQQKQKQLQNSGHAISLLFPLGHYLYNLAWQGHLLITFVPLTEFQDKADQIQKIIKSNNDILTLKDLNTQLMAQRRKALDKEMGKIVASVDVGIFDREVEELMLPHGYAKLMEEIGNPRLLKFLGVDTGVMLRHLRSFALRFGVANWEEAGRKIQKVTKYLHQQRKETNLLLYSHRKYLSFPFEGMDSLKSQAIFRIPSAQYLLKARSPKHHNAHNLKYLINTKNDLAATQAKFELIRKKYDSWVGIKGRDPSLMEAVHLLEREIFLFMGHGTGLEHIGPKELGSLRIQCLMLVFGCSSAKMVFEHSQPHGWAFQMLLRGCPGYLGCLWNVTDVDTDKITVELFDRERSENLSLLVNSQRKRCAYVNINGLALVVYGIPCEMNYEREL